MGFLVSFLIFILSCFWINVFSKSPDPHLCHIAERKGSILMDMAAKSADYRFIHSPESDLIAINYIEVERKNNATLFDKAWIRASEEWKYRKSGVSIPDGLREEHIIAVLCYTLDEPPLYRYLNQAMRNYGVSDEVYSKCFHYKSLHYLLSVTLGVLWNRTGSLAEGAEVYRGMDRKVQVREGASIRFGQFASTSLDITQSVSTFTDSDADTNTLFNITTVHGVAIQNFSFFRREEEVLIPPYEVFKVVRVVDWEGEYGVLGANIVLSSTGTQQTEVRLELDSLGHLQVARVLEAASPWWLPILVILLVLLLAACIMLVVKRKLITG